MESLPSLMLCVVEELRFLEAKAGQQSHQKPLNVHFQSHAPS